jgi:hypothetical protein
MDGNKSVQRYTLPTSKMEHLIEGQIREGTSS